MNNSRQVVKKGGVVAWALATTFLMGATQVHARPGLVEWQSSPTQSPSGQVESAFSPHEGAEALVLKVIGSARREIKVLAYSFTSTRVTHALLGKAKEGVAISVVADATENTSQDRSGKARAALSTLANAGVDVRLISVYAIHHDKVMVVDGHTVQTGSFNYSSAAEERNSENVIVHWGNRAIATAFLRHFQRNYLQGTPFQAR
jgi:phosphatidylserine/phosphatidylglycerophosphate/cardiolipin synthase-like enzyme